MNKIKKIIRELVITCVALGSLIAGFSFLLLGVWWLPQIMEFMELNNISHYSVMRILLPIGVFFWFVIPMILSAYILTKSEGVKKLK